MRRCASQNGVRFIERVIFVIQKVMSHVYAPFEGNVQRLNWLRLLLRRCFASSGNNEDRKMSNIYCRSGYDGPHAKAVLGGIRTKLAPPVSGPVCSENTPLPTLRRGEGRLPFVSGDWRKQK